MLSTEDLAFMDLPVVQAIEQFPAAAATFLALFSEKLGELNTKVKACTDSTGNRLDEISQLTGETHEILLATQRKLDEIKQQRLGNAGSIAELGDSDALEEHP